MPTHLEDYVVGNDNELSNEDIANFTLFADCDPVTFEEAVKNEHWNQAMDEEMHAIEKNKTCELTTLSYGKKPIGVKQVYKTKYKPAGEIDHYKVRLVVKGYKQKIGINYSEFMLQLPGLIVFA